MKKIIPFLCGIASALTIYAQPGQPKKNPSPFKSLSDSASYAIGLSVANFYQKQGITRLNTILLSKAINDVLGGTKPLIDEATANTLMTNYMNSIGAEKAKVNIDAGKKCQEQNKVKPGIKTTPSGLQYEVLKEGNGIKPAAADSVTCNYKGTLLNGTEFDNSYKRGQPITFPLGGVIAGWTEGLQLMSVGSKFRFWIPYNLGYGLSGYSTIPGGATLVFEVELLDVKKKQ